MICSFSLWKRGKFSSPLSQPINFCQYFSPPQRENSPDVTRGENQFSWRLEVVFVTKRWKTITLSIFLCATARNSLSRSIMKNRYFTVKFLYVACMLAKKIIFPPFFFRNENCFSKESDGKENVQVFSYNSLLLKEYFLFSYFLSSKQYPVVHCWSLFPVFGNFYDRKKRNFPSVKA